MILATAGGSCPGGASGPSRLHGCAAHAILLRLVAEVNVAQKPHHPGHTHTRPEPGFPMRRDFLSSLISVAGTGAKRRGEVHRFSDE